MVYGVNRFLIAFNMVLFWNFLDYVSTTWLSFDAGPPLNVTVFSPSSRDLAVTWDSPVDQDGVHGTITSYTVTCNAVISHTIDVQASEENINVTMEVSFDELLPYTTYNCCVSMETTKANSSAACQEGLTLEEGIFSHCLLVASSDMEQCNKTQEA